MREKIFTLIFIVVLLGIIDPIFPVDAIPQEEELLPIYEGISNNRVGNIAIDLANAHYAALVNVGEQNRKLYFELMAHNPSGVPATITWGMVQANGKGHLSFNGKFDSNTFAWVRNFGLKGATYSVRYIKYF